MPAHIGLDGIERADPFEDIGGQRGWLGLVDIEDLAAEVRPAGNLGDAPTLVELVISGIGIGLEKTGEAGELGPRIRAGAIGGEAIPDQRRRGGPRSPIIDSVGP